MPGVVVVRSTGAVVLTVPDAPTAVTATPGDTTATVYWTWPANTGGSDIISYTATSSPGGLTVTVSSIYHQGTVTGLTNGTAYTFTVVATNAIGDSAASAASNSVTPVAVGGSYYISPTGSDTTGNGSASLPWATVTKFLTVATAGDTLYCRGGTYTGDAAHVITSVSGTAAAPITITNYTGETPVFQGDGAAYDYGILGRFGASHWVIDGLQFENFVPTQTGIIAIGGTYGTTVTPTSPAACTDWTIRNCRFEMAALPAEPYSAAGDHAVYLSIRSSDVTIEDCVFVGAHVLASSWLSGAGVHIYYSDAEAAGVDTTVTRCIFDGWEEGMQLWNDALTGTFTHLSFLNCEKNIDARVHAAITIRDCAGENGTTYNIYDPTYSAQTTEDHNFWAQTFDASYYLLPGNTGIDAASDGTDAGALDT